MSLSFSVISFLSRRVSCSRRFSWSAMDAMRSVATPAVVLVASVTRSSEPAPGGDRRGGRPPARRDAFCPTPTPAAVTAPRPPSRPTRVDLHGGLRPAGEGVAIQPAAEHEPAALALAAARPEDVVQQPALEAELVRRRLHTPPLNMLSNTSSAGGALYWPPLEILLQLEREVLCRH